MSGNVITVEAISKRFTGSNGRTVVALDDVGFNIAEGEFVSIVGPSGCGKTTLLRIVAGTISATSGTVHIAGERVTGPSRAVGVVFQTPVLFPWRTIFQNVMVPAQVRRQPHEKFAEKAYELLNLAGLAGFINDYPWQLSGGMQQRAAICRALTYDPAFILLDEPFGALDAMTRETMNLELMRLCSLRRSSALLITHSIPEAVFLSDRVLVMTSRPGRVADDIRIDLPRPRTLDVLGTPEFARLTHQVRTGLNQHHVAHA